MLSPHSPLVYTILVVDDEPALRSFAEILLQDLGYAALQAESGRAAVQLLLQDPQAIDAVLLDMTMPGMKPEETFRLLTEIRPGLPVIVLSGELESFVRERFGVGTIAGYVQKPYTDLELEVALTQALARPLPSQPTPFRVVPLSDHELDEAKSDYLAIRRLELPKIDALLAACDFEALRIIGHSLKGSGGCFGFSEITHIGKELERCAQEGDALVCADQVDALKDCVRYLSLKEGPATYGNA